MTMSRSLATPTAAALPGIICGVNPGVSIA